MSLLDRLPFRRKPAESPPLAPLSWEQQGTQMVRAWVEDLPYVKEVRLFWLKLERERPLWPVLLPLLAIIGWHTYHSERRKVLEEKHQREERERKEKEAQERQKRYRQSVILHR